MDRNIFFDIVLGQVKDLMKQHKVQISTQESIVKVMRMAMECVELIRDEKLKGNDKKAIVLKVLRFLVEESGSSKERKKFLSDIIEGGTLETSIDLIIDASRGNFQLNKKTKRKLFSCLGSCLVSASNSCKKPNHANDANDKIPKNVYIIKEEML